LAEVAAVRSAVRRVMIGNGAQAEFQALAMKDVCGIDPIRLYDIDPLATEKMVRNLVGTGLTVTACSASQSAIENVEIITTCTVDKHYATILTDKMV
ncbi:ornithine cyclodeaminase, partial [Rhizobium leguminosarum]